MDFVLSRVVSSSFSFPGQEFYLIFTLNTAKQQFTSYSYLFFFDLPPFSSSLLFYSFSLASSVHFCRKRKEKKNIWKKKLHVKLIHIDSADSSIKFKIKKNVEISFAIRFYMRWLVKMNEFERKN